MPGLMDLLLDTMPLAAVESSLHSVFEGIFTSAPPAPLLRSATGADLKPYLEFLPKGQTPSSLCPLAPGKPTGHAVMGGYDAVKGFDPIATAYHSRQNIWGFDLCASAMPAELCAVTCRVSGEDYANFLVFDRVRFGYEASPGSYQPIVKAVDTTGRTVELPLSDAFLYMSWLTHDTALAAGHPVWKLESHHDAAILRVFVYELIGDTTTPTPLTGETPEEQAAFDAVLAAAAGIGPSMGDDDDAASRLFGDTTFFPEGLTGGVGAPVGESAAMRTTRTRIVVAVSFTMCKWRCDFPPGILPLDADRDGVENPVGGAPLAAGRFHPHAMIFANRSFKRFEISLQLDRPDETKNLDNESECCKSAPTEMLPDLSTVLVTEANEPDLLYPGPPIPIWSNLFAYFQTDGHANLGQQRLPLVRCDRPLSRTAHGLLVRHADPGYVPAKYNQLDQLTKRPRQGAFDSIHLAPPMKVPAAQSIASTAVSTSGFYPDATPISVDPALQASFQRIGMAPFCAHDCFHFHWRWADYFCPGKYGEVQHTGWGKTGAYEVPGAPMVPFNQGVELWHRAPCQVTYHVVIGADGNDVLPGAPWPVVCHHGGAYGLDASSWLAWTATKGMDVFGLHPYVLNANGNALSISWSGSWALLYWRLRYTAEVTTPGSAARLDERTVMLQLQSALDL